MQPALCSYDKIVLGSPMIMLMIIFFIRPTATPPTHLLNGKTSKDSSCRDTRWVKKKGGFEVITVVMNWGGGSVEAQQWISSCHDLFLGNSIYFLPPCPGSVLQGCSVSNIACKRTLLRRPRCWKPTRSDDGGRC